MSIITLIVGEELIAPLGAHKSTRNQYEGFVVIHILDVHKLEFLSTIDYTQILFVKIFTSSYFKATCFFYFA